MEYGFLLVVPRFSQEDFPGPATYNLGNTVNMDAQGLTRLVRGFSFFESVRVAAEELGVPFNWHIATVLGVAHSNTLMAPAAIPYLLH